MICLSFLMGIPKLVRWHLYIETHLQMSRCLTVVSLSVSSLWSFRQLFGVFSWIQLFDVDLGTLAFYPHLGWRPHWWACRVSPSMTRIYFVQLAILLCYKHSQVHHLHGSLFFFWMFYTCYINGQTQNCGISIVDTLGIPQYGLSYWHNPLYCPVDCFSSGAVIFCVLYVVIFCIIHSCCIWPFGVKMLSQSMKFIFRSCSVKLLCPQYWRTEGRSINAIMQDCVISIAAAIEITQSCTISHRQNFALKHRISYITKGYIYLCFINRNDVNMKSSSLGNLIALRDFYEKRYSICTGVMSIQC